MSQVVQGSLFDMPKAREKELSAVDELFRDARKYRKSSEFKELLRFMKRFKNYSPYNCLLLHIQRPGALCVATAHQWKMRFGVDIKDNAQPLLILAPKSPVVFVYDVLDTTGGGLADTFRNPFQSEGPLPDKAWRLTMENLFRDRILYDEKKMGAGDAGYIRHVHHSEQFFVEDDKVKLKAAYVLLANGSFDRSTKYATVAHELAHLYCGHLGTPNEKWWPDRTRLDPKIEEFEAETVCYLVCDRLGIKNPSAAYLSGYIEKDGSLPPVGLECILRTAGTIESMHKRKLKSRKEEDEEKEGRRGKASRSD